MTKAKLQEISSKQELVDLIEAAGKDHHVVIFPSHLVQKDGEVIGYAGIFSMPVLMWWLDSKKGKARDSLEMMFEIEKIAKERGVTKYATICSEDSPYYPHMGKLGYRELGKTVMFEKELV